MDALHHPYLEEGRVHYHTSLCSCCFTGVDGVHYWFGSDLEPSAAMHFSQEYEKELNSIPTAKGELCGVCVCVRVNKVICPTLVHPTAHVYAYMCSFHPYLSPLHLDTSSEQYTQFMRYCSCPLHSSLLILLLFLQLFSWASSQ